MTSITNISAKSSFSNATNSTHNKLSYRGNSYEVPAAIPFGSNSTTQPKIKLIYRGNSYEAPAPIPVDSSSTTQPKIKLIYRGNSFDYTPYTPPLRN
jgi:hypothetical protein